MLQVKEEGKGRDGNGSTEQEMSDSDKNWEEEEREETDDRKMRDVEQRTLEISLQEDDGVL